MAAGAAASPVGCPTPTLAASRCNLAGCRAAPRGRRRAGAPRAEAAGGAGGGGGAKPEEGRGGPWEPAVLAYLQDGVGLRGAAAQKVLEHCRAKPPLQDVEALRERHETWAGLVPDGAALVRQLARNPRLLEYTPETLREKYGTLEELLPRTDVAKLVMRQPSLLGRRTETLRTNLVALRELFGGKDVDRLLEYNASLLNRDPEALLETLAALEGLLPGVDCRRCTNAIPMLFEVNPDTLRRKFAFIEGLLPDVDVVKLVGSQPGLLLFKEETLADKLDGLLEVLPEVDAGVLMRHFPNALAYRTSTLQEKVSLLRDARDLLPGWDDDVDSLLSRRTSTLGMLLRKKRANFHRLARVAEAVRGGRVDAAARKCSVLMVVSLKDDEFEERFPQLAREATPDPWTTAAAPP